MWAWWIPYVHLTSYSKTSCCNECRKKSANAFEFSEKLTTETWCWLHSMHSCRLQENYGAMVMLEKLTLMYGILFFYSLVSNPSKDLVSIYCYEFKKILATKDNRAQNLFKCLPKMTFFIIDKLYDVFFLLPAQSARESENWIQTTFYNFKSKHNTNFLFK